MSTIAETIENEMEQWQLLNNRTRKDDWENVDSNLIIGHSLCELAMQIKASSIFSLSAHGNSPKALSSYRPGCKIIALTPDEKTARIMNSYWGITPILISKGYPDEMINQGIKIAKEKGYVKDGDTAVIGGSDTYDYHNRYAFNSYKTLGGICKL